MRSTPPPSQSGSAQTTPSPKGNAPPLQYPTHPSPHSANSSPHIRESPREQTPREPVNMPHVPNPQHMHNAHPGNPPQHPQQHPGMHPAQMGAPPPMQTQHPMPNHGRQHVHTPPHAYANAPPPPQQQQPPRQQPMPQNVQHNGPKPQMNGEAKPMPQRPPRNVYQSPNMQPPAQFTEPPPQVPPPKQEVVNCMPRHRDETVKVRNSSIFVICIK